jgi:hypothetical protein
MSCFAGMLEAFVSCLKTFAMYLKSVQENPATPEPEQEQQKFGMYFFGGAAFHRSGFSSNALRGEAFHRSGFSSNALRGGFSSNLLRSGSYIE